MRGQVWMLGDMREWMGITPADAGTSGIADNQ